MKLVINNLVGDKLSLENIIDILDEYSPQDECINLSLDTGIGQPIQASCRKDEWVTTREKFLLRIVKETLNSQKECPICSLLNEIFHT